MLVALPSSIAFGVLVFSAAGPSRGAMGALAGALGAAALGLFAPLIGGNGGFITAPCAPAAAIMSGFVAGLVGAGTSDITQIVALMTLTALLSAGMQVAFGLLGIGRAIKYIPYQVVTGYLSGVGLIIAVGQLPRWLGIKVGSPLIGSLVDPSSWRWESVLVGFATMAATVAAPRLTKAVPGAIVGLGAGLASYFSLALFQPELLQTSANPLVIGPITSDSSPLSAARTALQALGSVTLGDLRSVTATAATLAVLLSIDTLKTGVVLDALTARRHNSNRELVAQGVANAISALVGGMPGAGTMGPTLVNVTSGGRTPASGFFEGIFAVTAFFALRSLIAFVPIAALAGILLVVAARMFDLRLLRLLKQPATRIDFAVICAVIIVAKTIGLIQSSLVGIGLSVLLFMRAQIRGSVIRRKRDLREVASKTKRLAAEAELLEQHGDQGLLVELQDDLCFGTTDQLYTDLAADLQHRRYILLDLRRVQSMDYTAGHLLHQLHQRLAERGGRLLLSGLPSGVPTRQDIERYLTQLGLLNTEGGIPVHETRNDALEWMEQHILQAAGWSGRASDAPLELADVELFRDLDQAVLSSLAAIATPVELAAGEALFRQGEQGGILYVIRRGAIEILLPLPGGKRHHLATMARGDYFGELSFLDNDLRSADAIAKRETAVFQLSRAAFDQLARKEPVLAAKVFARIASMVSRRMRATNAELRALEDR